MRTVRLVLVVLIAICAGFVTALAEESSTRQIVVNCDEGQSVDNALNSGGLSGYYGPVTIEFTGTCVGDVTIDRDDVVVRGLDEGAEIVGTINIEGASRVTLDGFTVRDSVSSGIWVKNAAAVVLEGMVVRDNSSHGLLLEEGSSARIIDSSFLRNGRDGISVWGNSNISTQGVTEALENGRIGIILSTGSGMQGSGSVVANDNVYGLALQFAASAQIDGNLTTNGNLVGMYFFQAFLFAPMVEISGNAIVGVYAEYGNEIALWGGQIADNYVYVDGSNISLGDLTFVNSHLWLGFGSKASFEGGNTIDEVYCDGTVLTRGDAWCFMGLGGNQSVEQPQMPLPGGPLSK